MEEHHNLDEARLDQYIERLEKQEISMPEELSIKIRNRIHSLKPHRTYGKTIVAAAIVILLLFVGAVKWSPEFAAYAAALPGLKTAVEWIQGDIGIKHAKQQGYPEIKPIVVEERGYYLRLENIFMDEDRISLSAVVGGNEIMTYHMKIPAQREIRVGSEESLEPNMEAIGFSLDFMDFQNGAMISSSGNDQDAYLVRSVEKTFQAEEVEQFLSTDPKVLHVKAKIYQGREILHEFEDIHIPIDVSSVQLSQKFEQDQKIAFPYGLIMVEKLTVSPTRMRIDVGFDIAKDYFFTGFENMYLKDERGNTYAPDGLISSHWSEDRRSMYFVPSLFFDRLPKELFLCFDGVRIGTKEGQEFTLSLGDSYPKTISYMGEDIIIQSIQLSETNKLRIEASLPNEERLKVQSFHIKDYAGAKSWSEYEGVLQSFFDVPPPRGVYFSARIPRLLYSFRDKYSIKVAMIIRKIGLIFES